MGLPRTHTPPSAATSAALGVERSTELATTSGDWPPSHWWTKYGDATLDQLIAQAAGTAPSLATAEARFNNAREAVRVSATSAGLHVDASASVARQRLSDNGLFPTEFLGFHWYNQADLGLRATYSFDWWHKRRAATEAAVNEARAAQAERSAAGIALAAAIADSYFGWQADQAQLALLDEQQRLLARQQDIVAARIRAELEPAGNLYQLNGDVAALRATRIELEASSSLRRVVIAALLGMNPEQLPKFTARPLPSVAAQLPDTVRIDLLARRADIVAGRWRIEAAEQQLNVARAEFMPDISVNALAGFSSIDLGKLLNAGSAVPAIGAALHLPIFDSGRLQAQYGVRAAQLDAAVAAYNDTVVNAARQVATQVITLQKLTAQREQRVAQVHSAEQQLNTAEARKRQGLTDNRPVLTALQLLQQQRSAVTTLDAAALSTDINLQLALGGGYTDGGYVDDQHQPAGADLL